MLSSRATTTSARAHAWPPVFAVAIAAGLVLATIVYSLSSGSDERIIAALLAFFGVLVTAAVKNHVDMRSEQRLRLDAAMAAGRLLSPTDGGSVSRAAAASGLLALADLGRTKLAVAILLDLWANGRVSPDVAVLVIDKALASGDDTTAEIAAEVLCQNAHKLDPTKPAHWPSILDSHWVPRATEKTKILLIESLVEMSIHSRSAPASINALRAFAIRIVFIHDQEHRGHVRSRHFRKCIAGFAAAIAPALALDSPGAARQCFTFIDGKTHIDKGKLDEVARDFQENPDTFFADVTAQRRSDLAEWALKCRSARPQKEKAGALAAVSCQEIPVQQKALLRA